MYRAYISLFLAAAAFAQTKLVNPGFEEGELGAVPTGWFLPPMLASAGFGAKAVDQNCRTGARCAMLSGVANPPENMFGNLIQSLPAAGYNLRRIRLRAAMRVEGPNTRAQMWLRLDRADNSMAFLENMGTRPVTSPEWKPYDIVATVPEDASRIVLGVMLFGAGNAWVDDVTLDILEEVHVDKPEPARPLTPQGLTNPLRVRALLPSQRSGRPHRLGDLRHRRRPRRGRRGFTHRPSAPPGEALSAHRAHRPDLPLRQPPCAARTAPGRRDHSLPPQRRRPADFPASAQHL